MLRPISSSSLSSSTTTCDPVSSLHPSVLFPFFHPGNLDRDSSGRIINNSTSPSTSTRSNYEASSDSPCDCDNFHSNLPAPSFISVPSQNPNQNILLPMPNLINKENNNCPIPNNSRSACTNHRNGPMLVFSHGTTQVDTLVPSTRSVQRTRYSWSQLADYSLMKCSDLPSVSHSNVSQSGSSMRIENGFARICPLDNISSCQGHQWVNFSYTVNVRQWQENESEMAKSEPNLKQAAAMPEVQIVDELFASGEDEFDSEYSDDEIASTVTTEDDEDNFSHDDSDSDDDGENAMRMD